MTLPLTLASGPVPGVDDFARLLRSLLPNGYTREDESSFFAELRAWAAMLHVLDQERRRLRANALRASTVEMIDEWEHEYGLIDDATRELSERQARLIAAETAHGGASPSRLAAALALIGDGITVHAPSSSEITWDNLAVRSPHLIYQARALITEAQWGDRALRKSLARVLERIMPTRNFGQDSLPSVEASISTSQADWASADSILGRTSLRFQIALTATHYAAPVQRLREWVSGSVLRATDVHAIQDSILRKPARGTDASPTTMTFAAMTPGDERWAFALDVSIGTQKVVSADGDWRYRFVRLSVRAVIGQDIRPGQSDDDSFSAADQFDRVIYTGAGDAASTSGGLFATLTPDLEIYADSTNGHLYIRNVGVGVAGTIVGFVSRSAPHNDATGSGDRLVTCEDGESLDDAGVNAAFYDALRYRGALRVPTSADVDAWSSRETAGGRTAVAYLVNFDDDVSQVIDDSMEWFDRIVYAQLIAVNVARWGVLDFQAAGPLGTDDMDGSGISPPDTLTAPWGGATPGDPIGVVGYTRVGLANGGVSNASKCIELGTELRLWVNASDGSLNLTRDLTESYPVPETYLLVVESSFVTGAHVSAPNRPTLGVVDADPIAPLDLNTLQDVAICGVLSDSHPLGTHPVNGGAARPIIPELRRYHGFESPQGVDAVGGVRRLFATYCDAASEQILDDTIDWRDRFVRASVVRSHTYDVLPGHAGEAHANDDAAPVFPVTIGRYTGAGGHATVGAGLDRGYHLVLLGDTGTEDTGICIYARASDGALILRNQNGLDTHVFGFIDATFQLGLR